MQLRLFYAARCCAAQLLFPDVEHSWLCLYHMPSRQPHLDANTCPQDERVFLMQRCSGICAMAAVSSRSFFLQSQVHGSPLCGQLRACTGVLFFACGLVVTSWAQQRLGLLQFVGF
jgi:hypothetical protein